METQSGSRRIFLRKYIFYNNEQTKLIREDCNIDPHRSKEANKNCNNFFCKRYGYWKLQIAINFKELILYFLMMQKIFIYLPKGSKFSIYEKFHYRKRKIL